MAQVIITLKIMPDSPETDIAKIEKEATLKIMKHGADVGKTEIEEMAFGLKSLKIYFIMDESKGSTEALEAQIAEIDDVTSVEVIDVRRAIG